MALVCHDISDVVIYSSRKSHIWLIDKSFRIILNDNNMVGENWIHKFIRKIGNILSLVKYKSIFLEFIISLLIYETKTILGSTGS